ncbi:MAG: GntR family transcriptional regulator [Acidimicrobiales bacterium]|nr:GntR family transcriptional regulator [Acidimicrobiales bacterium]MDG1877018.1 GntR family transcriptional regulator [Acidimicrobiales bacterium]
MSDTEPDLNPVIEYTDRAGEPRRLVIRLDPRSGVPRFEQLRAQLSVMVAVGRLSPADRLPTVRDLARQLGLAPGTVARSYRELERDGVVVTRGRAGTFVADEPPHSEPLRERRERLRTAALRYVFDMQQLGVAEADIATAVAEAVRDDARP